MGTKLHAVAWAVILAVVLGSQAASAVAASPLELERTVFIHYRATPDAPGLVERTARGAQACPDASTCADYSWRGHKWFGGSVSYQLDASASGVGTATAADAVAASFAAWTAAVNTGATRLVVSPSASTKACSEAGTVTNGANQICWRDLTSAYPNAIAVTFIWSYRSTKEIVEADAIFNNGSGFAWSYTDPGTCGAYGSCNAATGVAGTYDIRNIGTHEFGHFLALLGDLYKSKDRQLTMYGYGSKAELQKDSLAKGDCLGITSAYGGSCP